MNEYDKFQSRKWKLVLYVIIIATFGVFVPPVLSAWLLEAPLIILDGNHFVALITLIVSAYFGANVLQKKVVADTKKTEIKPKEEGEA